MSRFRTLPLTKAVVAVLLIWTALDLFDAGLCAAEQILTPGTVADLALTSAAPRHAQDSVPSPGHVDDCFCCSQCVEISGIRPAVPATPLRTPATSLIVAAPRDVALPLYHPPQGLLQ